MKKSLCFSTLLFLALHLQAQNVGIGTALPQMKLHIKGGLLLDSTNGSTPVSGAGTRLMWIPAKAAFRAGMVTDTMWNDAHIGIYSFASGTNSRASGIASTAMGTNATASAENSVAMGGFTTASGYSSTALGNNTLALGDFSTALGLSFARGYTSTAMGYYTNANGAVCTTMGEYTIATGQTSTAMGAYSNASGNYSTAMGLETIASGISSTAMGSTTTASGNSSTAMGNNAHATALYSIAMGHIATASAESSIAMGNNATASAENSVAMGSFTTASGYSSTALGNNTLALGDFSTALGLSFARGFTSTAMGYYTNANGAVCTTMGEYTTATGQTSTAMGAYSNASGNYSTAMGNATTASGDYSSSMGNYTKSKSFGGFVTGIYNDSTNAASAIDFNPLNRLFQIGNGTADNARSNAITVLQNGNMGIGELDPAVPLNFASSLGNKISLWGNAASHYGMGIQSNLMQFYVPSNGDNIAFGYGSSAAFTETVRLLGNGNMGIGTTAPSAKLSVNGTANNSTGAWGLFSDERIKTISGNFTDGLNVINQIKPVLFKYNDKAPFQTPDEQIGIVAQELEKIAPYMVSKKQYNQFTDLREVDNQAYVFLLINAVKEQQVQIEAGQKENAEQKQRIDNLEKIVNELSRKISL